MKVLLIWPLSDTVESDRSKRALMQSRDKLGILYIASYLEKYNINVTILDMDIEYASWHKARKVIKRLNPDIVGISIMTHTRFTGFKAAKMVKKILPKCLVVAGGPHVSPTARDTLSYIKAIDVVVIGEGEETMYEICNAVANGKDLTLIDGIAYRRNGEYFETKPRKTIENLDILPFPARHLLKRYYDKSYPKSRMLWVNKDGNFETTEVASIITSRGCPNRCSFCTTNAIFGKKVRERTPENIIAELEHIVNNYNTRSFYIVDDTLTMNEPRITKICDLIAEKKLGIQWMCLTRVDCLSLKLLEKMKAAGCVYITMGVESGSQRVLDEIIKKRITLEQARKALSWCRDIGIGVRFNFMLSFPDETYKEMLETLNASIELGHSGMNITVIMPGTEIEKEALKRGVLPNNFTWSRRAIYPKVDPFFTGIEYYYIENIDFPDVLSVYLKYANMQKYYTTNSLIKRHIEKILQIKSFSEIYWLFMFYLGTSIVMLKRKFFKIRQII